MATALSRAPVVPLWGYDRRGFWTRRRRAATALLAVLALLAGLAFAFKLFDVAVPNSVIRDASNFSFAVEVLRPDGWKTAGPPPSGQPIFQTMVSQYPGDARTEEVRIRNTNTTPARDASFFVYVEPASIEVRGCVLTPSGACSSTPLVDPADPLWARYVNLWTLSVNKEKVLTAGPADLNENDHSLTNPPPDLADHDRARLNQRTQVCSGSLRTIVRTAPCNLGRIERAGSTEVVDNGLQPTDTRWYQFVMTESDDGTDQSVFRGWTITFTLVFQARVPPVEETGAVRER